ncbi:MAG: RNA polymerase sporulation sigma factor SigK [Clostridia bacterium]|nr:RNA polymerase sporulation sigma factor SigK [Clostridia bacterium]
MFSSLFKFLKRICGINYDKAKEQMMLYLSNNEALPSPMSAIEEKECVERMLSGNIEAKAELIEKNLRLVVYIAKKFENTGVELEDLISVGSIGLIKAVNTFNNTKQIKLATYASRCIENEILMHLRKTSKQKNETSLDSPLSLDADGNELLLSDVIGIDAEEIFKNIEAEADKGLIYKALEKLNKREQQIVSMRFGLNGIQEQTQKQVADNLKISQSYISRIEKKILNKMKKEISNLS